MAISDFLKDVNLSHLTNQTLLYFTFSPLSANVFSFILHNGWCGVCGILGAENGNDAEVNGIYV